jgi:AraC family transcriptional regulator
MRLGAAIDYLEAALRGAADLNEAARRCGLSRWYFMRVFQAAAGMGVGEYVRVRRLSCAAEELAAGRPVSEAALAWGYESQATFTRAFSRTFGVSPAAYARGVLDGHPPLDLLLPIEPRLPPGVDDVAPPTHVEREPFRLVGLRLRVSVFTGQPSSSVPALWADWMGNRRWLPLGGHPGSTFLGLSTLRASGVLEYVLGMVAGPETPVPAGYLAVNVRGGTWAVFTACGPPAVTARTLVFAAHGRYANDQLRGRRPAGWDIHRIEPAPDLPAGSMRCQHWVPLGG